MTRSPTWRIWNCAFYDFVIYFMGGMVGLYWDDKRIAGRHNAPLSGPLLIVCNHLNVSDPWFVAHAIPRRVHFMAKREAFASGFVGWGLRNAGTFPVDREGADTGAIRTAIGILDGGGAICMFPEGTRSRSRVLSKPHPGAAYLALRSQAPVLPIAICGTEEITLPRMPGPTPAHVRVAIGAPFRLDRPDGVRASEVYERAGHEIMRRIGELLPERYRGTYADADEQCAPVAVAARG